MTDLRTAAQQALEFIRTMNRDGWMLADYESDMERTVAGLEAALAQEQAEPTPGEYHGWVLREVLFDRGEPVGHREPQWQAQEQPAPEPVAWMDPETGDPISASKRLTWERDFGLGGKGQAARFTVPLYTAPPQRPLLTDEEIDKASAQERDALLDHIYEYGTAAEGVLERIRKLCRAIERAVMGEK